jgi:1-deoxy-D-xylulose-5-phosphate reductoisomerase
LKNISPELALNHPIWKMGQKLTIHSATLMKKGLEANEAHRLFGVSASNIDIVIHPESVIHSMVYFTDGSVKTQMSSADMRIPIQFALTYPDRFANSAERLDLVKLGALHFEAPDVKIFRNLALAFEALKKGGNLPCILNAANEIAVQAFLKQQVGFLQISNVVEYCMDHVTFIKDPTLDDYFETDKITRFKAIEFIN